MKSKSKSENPKTTDDGNGPQSPPSINGARVMKVYNYPQMRPKKTSVKPVKGGGKAVDAETKLKSLEEALLNRRTDPSLDFPPTVASADEKPSSESTTDVSEDAGEVEPSGESLSVPESPDNALDREDLTETPAAEDISTKRGFSDPPELEIHPSDSPEVQHDQHAALPPTSGRTAPQASEPNPWSLPANIGETTGELDEMDLATATEDPENPIKNQGKTGSEASSNVAFVTNQAVGPTMPNGNDRTKSDVFQSENSSARLVRDGISQTEGKDSPSDSTTAKAPIAEPPGDFLPPPTTNLPAATPHFCAEEQTKDSGQADIASSGSTEAVIIDPEEMLVPALTAEAATESEKRSEVDDGSISAAAAAAIPEADPLPATENESVNHGEGEPRGETVPVPTTEHPVKEIVPHAADATADLVERGEGEILEPTTLAVDNEVETPENVTIDASAPPASDPAAGSATLIAQDVIAEEQVKDGDSDAEHLNPNVEDKPSDGAPPADDPKKKKQRPEPVVIILPLLADRPARLAELYSKLEALLASMTAQHPAVFKPGPKKDSALRAVRNRLFPTPYDFDLAAKASEFFKQEEPKFGKLMVQAGTCLELLHRKAPQEEKKFAAVFAALVLEYPWGPPPCLRSKLKRFKWVDAETVGQAT